MTPNDERTAVMTSGRLTRVPNQPKTPQKSFRIPPELFEAAKAKAIENGETVTDVVRRALAEYIDAPTSTVDDG